jgi:hypothetical protein|nr:MAG TPA: hypothetical protein [Caudoviricetes sp.]DAL26634.1 MAG TPA_asm: hypothetical protein [Caudoviricetes sp.]
MRHPRNHRRQTSRRRFFPLLPDGGRRLLFVWAFDWRRVMALYPKRIEVDARRGRVPLIADEIVFRAGVEVSQCSSKPRLK